MGSSSRCSSQASTLQGNGISSNLGQPVFASFVYDSSKLKHPNTNFTTKYKRHAKRVFAKLPKAITHEKDLNQPKTLERTESTNQPKEDFTPADIPIGKHAQTICEDGRVKHGNFSLHIHGFDQTCLKSNSFRFASVVAYDYAIDPHHWLLRRLEPEEYIGVNHDLLAYINLTSRNPTLFARHELIRATVNIRQPEHIFDRYYLGCAMNTYDLLGYLQLALDLVSPDLLYYAAHCACRIIRILNTAGFVAAEDDLKEHFQVWRVSLKQFEVRLASFVGFNPMLPYKSGGCAEINLRILEQFLEFIAGRLEKHPSHSAKATVSWLKSAMMEERGQKIYDMEEVNNCLSRLHSHMVEWFPITPPNPLRIP